MKTPITTRNEEWGFYGTMLRNEGAAATPAKAQAAWNEAIAALVETAGMTAEVARDFLDSRYGRHLADELSNQGGNVRAAIARFPKWIAFFKKNYRAGDYGEA